MESSWLVESIGAWSHVTTVLVDLVRCEFQRAAIAVKYRRIYYAMIEQKRSVVFNPTLVTMALRSLRIGRAHFNARTYVVECLTAESMLAKLLATNKMPALLIAHDHRMSCHAALVAKPDCRTCLSQQEQRVMIQYRIATNLVVSHSRAVTNVSNFVIRENVDLVSTR